MNKRTTVTLFNRHAKHTWICDKCGQNILKKDLYRDQEIKVYTEDTTKITHRRLCAKCAGLIATPHKTTFVFKAEEPVSSIAGKEWLVGKGYNRERQPKLLTLDWDRGEYHWRTVVYNADGYPLHYNNVEFI